MAHTPNISSLIISCIFLQLLWCHEHKAAAEVVLAVKLLGITSEAKVSKLHFGHLTGLVNVDQNIFHFDVSVHDSAAMAVVNSQCNLSEDVQLGLLGELLVVVVEVID